MGSSSSDRSVDGPDSDPLLHFGFGWETMEPETQFGWEPYPLSEEREIFSTREVRNLLSLGSLDAQEDRLLRFYRTLMGYFHSAAQTAMVNHRLLEEVRDDHMDLQRVQGDLRRQPKASEDLVSTLRFELQDARRASVEPASPPSCPPSNISSPHRSARIRAPSVSYPIPSPPASRPVGSSGFAADIGDIGDRDPSPRPSSADNVVNSSLDLPLEPVLRLRLPGQMVPPDPLFDSGVVDPPLLLRRSMLQLFGPRLIGFGTATLS
ncbi:hypothetical protein A4X13_0g5986 [Tilletia indica]|uniref:Uncharacterized protein n=1 Tax=Tilletia indica TaxID=43049 RepID=A0A177T649_9BASI|nr:hypothetical protein A4X13_0g5986 [Tilletia indica]